MARDGCWRGAGRLRRVGSLEKWLWISYIPMEGFWSLLRNWLRPHRGISQETLPLYLGFFEFVHNVRKRGKALLGALIELLVT